MEATVASLTVNATFQKTSTEGSDEVDLGVKNVAKKKRVKLDMPARADLLPEVVYPPELGYTNDKAAKWSKAEASSRIEKRAPAIRESGKPNQNKPKNPPPKESRAAAKANRKESPVRRVCELQGFFCLGVEITG